MKPKKSFSSSPTLLALSIASAVLPVMAEQSKVSDIETIEIQGSLMQGADVLIDQDSLNKKIAVDLADIFDADPEVSVGGSIIATQKVYVRGIEDSKLNVTVDGASQSGNMFHHQGRVQVEPELLKAVEITAGAGEATNGPGATGGAIRFETKDPQDLLDYGSRFGALVKGGYYSNTEGKKMSTSLYGKFSEAFSVLATLSKGDYKDYEAGNGNVQTNSDSEQQVAFAKLVGEISESQRFTLSVEDREEEGLRLQKPNMGEYRKKGEAHRQANERTTLTGNYYLRPINSDAINLQLTAYHTEGSLRHIEGKFGDVHGNMKTFGFDLRNRSEFGAHDLTYGIDYRDDQGELNQSDYDDAAESGTVQGIYIQDRFSVTDNVQLSFGARYDKYKLNTANALVQQDSGVSPNIGFSVELTDALRMHGGWAKALRGPQVRELFKLEAPAIEGRVAEEAENIELGLVYQLSELQLSAKLFDSEIDHAFGFNPITYKLDNVGKIETKGFILTARHQWENLLTTLHYSHARPELDGNPLGDDNLWLGTSTGDTLVAKLSYQVSDKLEMGWSGEFVRRLTDIPADTEWADYQEKPGYSLHDLYVQWSPLASDPLLLNLSINNLFDKYYFHHASYTAGERGTGIPAMGRDVRLSLTYSF